MTKRIIFLFFYFITLNLLAQTGYTLEECQKLFNKNNLLLLAEQYNISASKAGVIQAKIWDLPYISGEFNAVNPQNNTTFDVGPNGQKALAIQQLIYLGGKKKKEVDFARSNVAIAELQFEELLRTLKYQLSQYFYGIYFDQQKIKTIDFQINALDDLLKAYEVQSDRGNIPLKEVVRLQALVLGLKNEKMILQKAKTENHQELQLIAGVTEPITPVAKEEEVIFKFNLPKIIKDSLLSIAMRSNPEYLTALKISESQELYLRWQKSLAIPDLTSGLSYDQRGGAFINQTNVTFGVSLPYRNKNKGNIQIAEAQLAQSNLNKEYKKNELQSQIEAAWNIWQQQQEQLSSINKSISKNLEMVYSGVLSNFQKRNITILDFTDFMESYNQSTKQLNEMKKQLILSGLQLNFITNAEVL